MNALEWIRSILSDAEGPPSPLTAATCGKTLKKLVVSLVLEAIAAAAFSFVPGPAQSQEPFVTPGEQVRVRWNVASAYSYAFGATRFAIAEVVDYRPGSLLVRRGNEMITIPMSSVRVLERRIGTKPASAPEMVAGSGLGFLAGFTVGALKAIADPTVNGDSVVDSGIVSGVLIGAPLGALVAYVSSRRRGIYERLPVRRVQPAVSWTRDGQLGVSLTLPSS